MKSNISSDDQSIAQMIIDNHRYRIRLKAEIQILILAENKDDGESLRKYFQVKGFNKVEFVIPPQLEEGENALPSYNADLIVFHRSEGNDKDYYQKLSDAFLAAFIPQKWQQHLLLYFGPYNRELDTRTDQIVFSNYRQKLQGNIFELLEDQRDLNSTT